MFRDIHGGDMLRNRVEKPIEDTHLESQHFSSVILKAQNGIFCVEAIALYEDGSLDDKGNLDVKRISSGTANLTLARLSQSSLLGDLEERVKGGKTAKQALEEASKPTEKEDRESRDLWDRITDMIKGDS